MPLSVNSTVLVLVYARRKQSLEYSTLYGVGNPLGDLEWSLEGPLSLCEVGVAPPPGWSNRSCREAWVDDVFLRICLSLPNTVGYCDIKPFLPGSSNCSAQNMQRCSSDFIPSGPPLSYWLAQTMILRTK